MGGREGGRREGTDCCAPAVRQITCKRLKVGRHVCLSVLYTVFVGEKGREKRKRKKRKEKVEDKTEEGKNKKERKKERERARKRKKKIERERKREIKHPHTTHQQHNTQLITQHNTLMHPHNTHTIPHTTAPRTTDHDLESFCECLDMCSPVNRP